MKIYTEGEVKQRNVILNKGLKDRMEIQKQKINYPELVDNESIELDLHKQDIKYNNELMEFEQKIQLRTLKFMSLYEIYQDAVATIYSHAANSNTVDDTGVFLFNDTVGELVHYHMDALENAKRFDMRDHVYDLSHSNINELDPNLIKVFKDYTVYRVEGVDYD